jgi:glutamate racemase
LTIGVFDSGVGGLVMARAFRAALPAHDFLYLGDSLHVPYGPRSAETVYRLTLRAVDYLCRQDCELIVIACNTASASALRLIQQEYLPQNYPDRRVLGVIVPTIEAVAAGHYKRVGLLGTAFTVGSGVYAEELQKIDPQLKLHARAAPLLVPLAEYGALHHAQPVLEEYLAPLLEADIDSLILGCTHYPLFRPLIEKILPAGVRVISQDEAVPPKLTGYLKRHAALDARLKKNGKFRALLTDVTPSYHATGARLFGADVAFEKVAL